MNNQSIQDNIIFDRKDGKIVNVAFIRPPEGEEIDVGAFDVARIRQLLNVAAVPLGVVLAQRKGRLVAYVNDDDGLEFACALERALDI